MEYYDGINNGDFYLCDRCNVAKLNDYEYENNVRGENRYCDECRNWIILKKWKCDVCNASGTHRSEREFSKMCCNKQVTLLPRLVNDNITS